MNCAETQRQRGCRRMLWLLVVLGLHGCTVLGPDYQAREPAAPERWSDWHAGPLDTASLPLETDTPPAQWWTRFDDPVLDQLQARLHNSLELQDALLNFTRARLQRQLVAGEQGPQIDASAGIGRQALSEHGAQMRMATIAAPSPAGREALIEALARPYDLYQAGFDARWEPDLWGRIRRSIEAADAGTRGAAALLEQTRLTLAAELARQYFELRAVQGQAALLAQEIRAGEAQLALSQAQVEAGLDSELQLETRRGERAARRAALAALQARETGLRNAIARLLGERPGALAAALDAPESVGETDAAVAAALPLGLPSTLARRRPDIRAAEARLQAATADIGVATADLYPRVTLSAGLGIESFDEGKIGDWASRQWHIGPGFYLPIFNQGRLRTRVELTQVAQQRAAIAYRQTVLNAWQEIDNALSAWRAQLSGHTQLQQQLASARRQQQLIAASETAGLADQRATLDARIRVLQLQRQLADSSARLNINRVALYKAVGGGVPLP